MQPLPTPIPTSRSRCPAAPFLSISGLFTNQVGIGLRPTPMNETG